MTEEVHSYNFVDSTFTATSATNYCGIVINEIEEFLFPYSNEEEHP